jgi:Helicase HerA, central domain
VPTVLARTDQFESKDGITMSRIVIGKSGDKNVSIDSKILMTTRLLITADSGGGKTWLLKRLIEQAFGDVGIIVIDPEGEFAPLRTKLDFFLVGKGGDTPADVRTAEKVARTLLQGRASAICDIYEMAASERHVWVQRFLDALLDAPKELRHPYLVIVDEAHMFCPEHGKGESDASDAMRGLATRGRKRMLCGIFATQRLAMLAKDLTGMCLNRLVGPTFESINQKAAALQLGIEKNEWPKFFTQIKMLDPGYFYSIGRAITKDIELVHIGPIETPHGQEALRYELKPPPPTEKVREWLAKLGDLPKQAEEEARTVADFKKQIRELKAQLRSAPVATREVAVADPKAVERAVREVEQGFRKHVADLETRVRTMQRILTGIATTAANAVDLKFDAIRPFAMPKISGAVIQKREDVRGPIQPRPNIPSLEGFPSATAPPSESNGKLRAGAERMLAALAQWHPGGMAEGQMRSHAGLKKSGTFSAYMSDLRRGGYIEERNGEVYASDAGLEYCNHVPAAPSTTREVLDIWNPKLRDGARRMLAIIVEAGGNPVERDDLMQRAALTKSGTTSAYLSDLKTARLIVANRDGTVSANRETLFL